MVGGGGALTANVFPILTVDECLKEPRGVVNKLSLKYGA